MWIVYRSTGLDSKVLASLQHIMAKAKIYVGIWHLNKPFRDMGTEEGHLHCALSIFPYALQIRPFIVSLIISCPGNCKGHIS